MISGGGLSNALNYAAGNSRAQLELEELRQQREQALMQAQQNALMQLTSGVSGALGSVGNIMQNDADRAQKQANWQADFDAGQTQRDAENLLKSREVAATEAATKSSTSTQALQRAKAFAEGAAPGLVTSAPADVPITYTAPMRATDAGFDDAVGGLVNSTDAVESFHGPSAADQYYANASRDLANKFSAANPDVSPDDAFAMIHGAAVAEKNARLDKAREQTRLESNDASEAGYRTAMAGAEKVSAQGKAAEGSAAMMNARTNAALVPSKIDKNEMSPAKAAADAKDKADLTQRLDQLDKVLADPRTDPDSDHTKAMLSERNVLAKRLGSLMGVGGGDTTVSLPPPGTVAGAQPTGTVMMRNPQGQVGPVPVASVDAAKQAGYVQVQ